jgi:hypothetical protein
MSNLWYWKRSLGHVRLCVTVARGINQYYPRPDRLEHVSGFLFRHERHFNVHAGTQQYNIKVVANRWRADQHVEWRMHAAGTLAGTGVAKPHAWTASREDAITYISLCRRAKPVSLSRDETASVATKKQP